MSRFVVIVLLSVITLPAHSASAATAIPLPNSWMPYSVGVGPDRNVWFTASEPDIAYSPHPTLAFGHFNRDGSISVVSQMSGPLVTTRYPSVGLVGPDGNFWTGGSAVYFSPQELQFVRTTPAGAVTTFPSHLPSGGVQIIDGPDGNMWFTHTFTPSGPEKGIGQLTPTGQVRIFTTGFPAGTSSITKGPDGAVWFTTDNNRIGRITMSGHVTLIPIPRGTFGAAPASIATGTDGNLWVVYTKTAPILRIRPSGQVTELCRMTSIGAAEDIEAGPDGDIWIDRGSSLVRVDPRGNAYSYDHLGVAGRSVGLPFVGEDGRVWFERVTGEYKAPGLLPGEPAHYVGVAGLARFSATEPFRQVCRAPRPRPKKPKR